MGVEETIEEQKMKPQNPNPNTDSAAEDLEDGEIVTAAGEEDDETKKSYAATVTHQLEHSWTFWFDNPQAKSTQTSWGSSIRPVYTFSTVEEFWSVYNNIHRPSKLGNRADLYCFKDKIEPKWEDPVCANGGKWTAEYTRGKSDIAWLYTLLAMIGEQFDHGDEICGAVVNIRGKIDKVSVWTKNAANEAAQMSIGNQWKELIDFKDSIGFIIHDDAIKLERAAKNRYTA
ncbi:hypothetical protein ACFE04_013199 [Oxalis oulophora]